MFVISRLESLYNTQDLFRFLQSQVIYFYFSKVLDRRWNLTKAYNQNNRVQDITSEHARILALKFPLSVKQISSTLPPMKSGKPIVANSPTLQFPKSRTTCETISRVEEKGNCSCIRCNFERFYEPTNKKIEQRKKPSGLTERDLYRIAKLGFSHERFVFIMIIPNFFLVAFFVILSL